jgi:hypothetical protein
MRLDKLGVAPMTSLLPGGEAVSKLKECQHCQARSSIH